MVRLFIGTRRKHIMKMRKAPTDSQDNVGCFKFRASSAITRPASEMPRYGALVENFIIAFCLYIFNSYMAVN